MEARQFGWALVFLGLATAALSEAPEQARPPAVAAAPTTAAAAPVVTFSELPQTRLVSHTTGSLAGEPRLGAEVFRHGAAWYVHDGGSWYRARSSRGPFRAVDVRSVPRAILDASARNELNRSHGVAAARPEARLVDAGRRQEDPGAD